MGNPGFLGFAAVRPFQRDGRGDFATAGGVANVQAAVEQVLLTEAMGEDGRGGELPWNPSFGSLLYRIKHRKGAVLAALAPYYVADALARWEPRVRNVQSQTTFDTSTRVLRIDLVYDVVDQNNAANAVVDRGVQQTVFLSTES